MPAIPFSSSDFLLTAAAFSSPTAIVARFTYPPDMGLYGYTLTVDGNPVVISNGVAGPGANEITLTVPVQPHGKLAILLADGNVTSSGVPAVASSVSFYTPALGTPDPLVQGVVNDAPSDILRRFLPPLFRNKQGWEALIAGLSAADQTVRDNAAAAFDQLFLSSASGNYLVERAADQGISYPDNAGMGDEDFRKLAILLANNRQIQQTLLGIIDVFYGVDSTRARLESATETFALTDGDGLTLVVDDRYTVEVVFSSADFAAISAATAAEVASVISKALRDAGTTAYAIAKTTDDNTKVVIYSGSIGLLGSLEVTTGTANKAIQFPTNIPFDYTTMVPAWHLDLISQDEFRFIWQQTNSPGTLDDVMVGDYVVVDAVTAPQLYGAYQVTDVQIDCNLAGDYSNLTWFSIKPPLGFPYTTLNTPNVTVNIQPSELGFFRPTRQTVVQNTNPAFIAQHDPAGGMDAILPVTATSSRDYNAAAYLHGTTGIAIDTVVRSVEGITVNTLTPHGFSLNQMVELEGTKGDAVVANNLVPKSEPLLADMDIYSVVQGNLTDYGLSNGVYFPGGGGDKHAAVSVPLVNGTTYTMSVFVEMDDLSAPVVSGGIAVADMTLVGDLNFTYNVAVTHVSGHLYRVSSDFTSNNTANRLCGIWQYNFQTGKAFKATGFQVEVGTAMGTYQKTPVVSAGRWGGLIGKITQIVSSLRFVLSNTFYRSTTNGNGSGGTAYPLTASDGDSLGPYIFDSSSPSVTATQTTTTASLAKNRGISILPVASTAGFPDSECWIALGFGTQYEVAPIRCLGIVDSNNLAIDRSYNISKAVPSGSTVILLAGKGGFEPTSNAGAFTLVDSSAGRVAAEGYLDESKAAGINLNKIVVYPGDRGLGGQGDPITGLHLTDNVAIWASDDVDAAVGAAHNA